MFELAMVNVDKPALTEEETLRRVAQFGGSSSSGKVWPVAVSSAPRFTEKTSLFKNCYFVVGADTAVRLVDPKYYGNSVESMATALRTMSECGAKFVVAGRLDQRKDAAPGSFLTLDDVVIPAEFKHLFLALPHFRVDLSSSQIRAKMMES